MARQYHLKLFLRQAPNVLLQRYFDGRQECGEVPWSKLKGTAVDPIFEAIENLPEQARRQVEQNFHDIFSMADEGMDEIRQHVKAINEVFRAAINGSSGGAATPTGPLVKAKRKVGYHLNVAPDEICLK